MTATTDIHVTGYPSEHDADKPLAMVVTWDQLVQSLSNVRETDCHPCIGADCPAKKGRCWSPVRMREGTQRRLLTNAVAVTALGVDLDDVTNAELVAVYNRLTQLKLAYVLHSTHQHLRAGPDHNYVRVVVPLSREVPATDYPAFWRAAHAELQLPHVRDPANPKKKGRGADPVCKDSVRLWFMPTRPRGNQYLVQRGEGVALDVDALTARAATLLPAPSPVASLLTPPSPQAEVEDDSLELSDLRKRLLAQKRAKASSPYPADQEKYRIYAAVLDGTALALPGARSATVNQAASMLAFALPVGTAWEVAVELVRDSVAAMDCELDLTPAELANGAVAHWLGVFEQSYNRAMVRAFSEARQLEQRRLGDQYAREALVPPTGSTAPAPTGFLGTLATLGSGITASPSSTDDSWVHLLIPTADGKVISCPHNVHVVLTHHPEVRGAIRLNLVTKDIEVRGGRFAGVSSTVLSTAVMNWLFASSLRIKVKKHEVEDQLLLVATEHQYDPIRDYLLGLEHDERPRLDDLFFTHLTARTTSARGGDLRAHLRRVSTKFMVSGVARALDPGCQVDTMLVFEGKKEGEGKTEFFRRLFGEYYTVTRQNLGDKDSQMIPASNWGVELGELSAMRKSEDEMLKTFLDGRTDKLRLPYGRRIEPFPRRCVFVGTTNNEHWLTYGKGRRRYWPVYVERVLLDLVSRDRDQLWAEAVVRYKAQERWHLTDEERAEADVEAEARVEETVLEAQISQWWYNMEPKRRPGQVALLDVVTLALKMQVPDALRARGLQTEIGIAMKRLGFEGDNPMVGGRRVRVWSPTADLLGGRAPNHLRVVRDPEDVFDDVAAAKVPG